MNEQTKPETIGQAIAADRLARGMSISDLSRAIDIPTQTISRWEAGGSEPRSLRAAQLVKFFGPDSWTASMAPLKVLAEAPSAGHTTTFRRAASPTDGDDQEARNAYLVRRRGDAKTRALMDHAMHEIGALRTTVYERFVHHLQRERLRRALDGEPDNCVASQPERDKARLTAMEAADAHQVTADELAKALVALVVAEGMPD